MGRVSGTRDLAREFTLCFSSFCPLFVHGFLTPIQTLSSQHLGIGFKITAFKVLFYSMDIMTTSRTGKVFTLLSETQDIFEVRNRSFFSWAPPLTQAQ